MRLIKPTVGRTYDIVCLPLSRWLEMFYVSIQNGCLVINREAEQPYAACGGVKWSPSWLWQIVVTCISN